MAAGDAADQKLARDIRRFVADMPVPLTRRQALAVELRQVLEQRSGREAPASPPAAQQPEAARREGPSLSQQLFPAEPTRKFPGR